MFTVFRTRLQIKILMQKKKKKTKRTGRGQTMAFSLPIFECAKKSVRLPSPALSKVRSFLFPIVNLNCANHQTLSGTIPGWLKGSFLRNGPGINKIGPDQYQHLFDGLALMQMFKIKDSDVTYTSRFLRSDSYKRNMKAQRIVVTEFGTKSFPDPCKTIMQRFTSYFTMDQIFTDNDMVGFYPIADQLYAVSDTPFLHRIDPTDLSTHERVDIRDHIAVNTSTSHPHIDGKGNVFNMGSNVGTYNITLLPRDGGLLKAQLVAQIPAQRPFSPGYYHSFFMTDNYFVFVEQPLVISVRSVVWEQLTFGTNSSILKWRPEYQVSGN